MESRRNFIQKCGMLFASAPMLSFAKTSNAMTQKQDIHSDRLTDLLGIDYPIIQGPVGGIATPTLAAAVSNAGGLGGLALSWAIPEIARQKIDEVRALTEKRFYVNFVLNFEPKALHQTLELGVDIIQFSWGMPSDSMIRLIKDHHALMGIQVTGRDSARYALELGADYLVCQGLEAGGHVQASRSLADALAEVLELAGNVPVVASGGISTGQHLYNYMQAGAAGVVMGTRFVASSQSGAHPEYKDAIVRSKNGDTALTVCMNKAWDNSLHRILRNSTFNLWERCGCPLAGERPGEFDIVGQSPTGAEIERYSISAPTYGTTGAIEAMALYAGEGASHIHKVDDASNIIRSIWNEYNTLKN